MATRLNPYLTFPGTAGDSMRFYESVFGGTLSISNFGDAGAEGVPDPSQVMHAPLETASGYTIMASDIPPGMDHQPGNDTSVSLSGDDADELRRYWDALSADGDGHDAAGATYVWRRLRRLHRQVRRVLDGQHRGVVLLSDPGS